MGTRRRFRKVDRPGGIAARQGEANATLCPVLYKTGGQFWDTRGRPLGGPSTAIPVPISVNLPCAILPNQDEARSATVRPKANGSACPIWVEANCGKCGNGSAICAAGPLFGRGQRIVGQVELSVKDERPLILQNIVVNHRAVNGILVRFWFRTQREPPRFLDDRPGTNVRLLHFQHR